MALHLEVSNSLEKLADFLIDKIRSGKRDVFTPITIVTQTEGINLWLRERMAKRLGIAINLSFITPNDIVFNVFRALGGQYEETVSRDTMVWLLYGIMGEKEFARLFPRQWSYFQYPYSEREKKRMGMALKMADLFDQYQIYRQDTIRLWNESPEGKAYGPDDWQEYLWKKLKQQAPKKVADKSTVRDFINANIRKPESEAALKQAIPAVYLFGLSIFTNYHLEILKQLAVSVPVYFFLLNPAPHIYWVEDVNEKQLAVWKSRKKEVDAYVLKGNPILTNWGKVLRNTFLQLFSGSDESINNYNDADIEPPRTDTLLHKVQADIFENRSEDHFVPSAVDLQDGTLSFHSNYTIAGEVDALYQYLVHLVDRQQVALSPRDISVMVSDIDKYAPYIRAVFDNAPYRFRYKIADTSIAEGDNIYSALKLLLELNENEFTSERVLQILESAAIRHRFRLEDTEALRNYTRLANIRFGIEGAIADETYTVSWKYGIQRLMYGVCMSEEPVVERNGTTFFPLDVVEGNQGTEIIRFCHFVDMLAYAVTSRKEDRTPKDWKDYVLWLVDNLIYQPENGVDEDYYTLTEQLSRFAELDSVGMEKVPFDVFRLNFLQSLETTRRTSLFINDGITFCSLIPMRSVPFKVIAMLGMDGKKFPRREDPVSFSLLAQTRQLGDRNVKDNDKHLFLETLLSARDYLYISYIGKNVKDNSVLPPSVLVDELLDYIGQMAGGHDITDILVTEYPLHGYSSRYNGCDAKLFRYDMGNTALVQSIFKARPNTEEMSLAPGQITVPDLIAFFRNAPKVYYNKVLGIYYSHDTELLQETEDFSLNKLQSTILKSEWLAAGEDADSLLKKWKLTGRIPLKNVGDISVGQVQATLQPILEWFREKGHGTAAGTIPVNLELGDNLSLTGELGQVYDDTLVVVCFSGSYVKYMVEAFLKGLIGVATGRVAQLCMVVASQDPASVPEFFEADLSRWNRNNALNHLKALARLYEEGLKAPYPFADIFYRKTSLSKAEPVTAEVLRKTVEDALNSFSGIPVDAYILKEYEREFYLEATVAEKYNQAFDLVLRPLLEIFPQEMLDLCKNATRK